MKKQIIEFKEKEYNESIKDLNYILDIINDTIPILVSNGIEPTFEIIKELFTNKKEFINNKFKEELNKIANNIGLSIEYIIANSLPQKYSVHGRVNRLYQSNKIQYIRDIKNICYLYHWCFDNKYFDIVDGKAVLRNDYLDKIREIHTIYTETSEQNEVLPIIQEIAKQYNKLGYRKGINIPYYLYYDNGEYKINGNSFKKVF